MNFPRCLGTFLKSCVAALCLVVTAEAADNWDTRFIPPPDTDGEVYTIVSSGNQIYAGGSFSTVNGIDSPGIAKWNGTTWESVGGGTDGEVYAIAISGNNVYIGGSFSAAGDADALNIAMWNGNNWTNLDAGLDNESGDAFVSALAVSGATVFAGGAFTMSDTNAMTNIARWNGSTWSQLGSGIDYVPATPDDDQTPFIAALVGNSTNLFAGGFFNTAGTTAVTNIARWNGTTWVNVGGGLDYSSFLPFDENTPQVQSLALQGTNLYAGGLFNLSGATTLNNIAVWNGTSWSNLGTGADDIVYSLVATNNNVYAGGIFSTIDSVVASSIARWTNSHWEPLSSGIDDSVYAIAVTASNVFVGGAFAKAGGVPAVDIARWNNANWSTLATGSANAPVGDVITMLLSGSNVYVGGNFDLAGTVAATNIAVWTGSTWTNVGNGVDGPVYAIAGNSTNLIVGGSFDFADTTPATNIARWNGTSWDSLGNGLDGSVLTVLTSGTNIYIGGEFLNTGSNSLNHIAQWNGTNWSPLGNGLFDTNNVTAVDALATFGNTLVAGGNFNTDGNNPIPFIAQWNGNSWSTVGTNALGPVISLAVSGSNLYAAGWFRFSDGSESTVARWDGTNWYALGDRFDADGGFLAVADSNVFVAGSFTAVGTNAANYVAKWTGQTWIPLATGLDSDATCIAADGTNAYVGGEFVYAGDSPSYHFGIWHDLPPNIWSPPLDGQVVSAGTNLTLSANVAGTPPISYQWFLNGGAIAGATDSTLTRTNVQSANTGIYTLQASNVYGVVLSDPASVQLDSVVVFADNFESGTVSNWTKLSTSSALVISTNKSHGGTYSALATNSLAKMYHTLGAEVEGHAVATFWIYDDQGTQTRWFGDVRNYTGGGFASGTLQQQLAIGLNATTFGTGTGDFQGEIVDTNSYQGQVFAGGSTGYFNLDDIPFPRTIGWHKFQIERSDDPTVIDFWIDDDIYRETSDTSGTTWDSTTIGSIGSGTVPGNVWFDDLKIEYLDPPDIITEPLDQVVNPGANVTFKVVATGNIRSYQWLKNNTLIAGATTSTYTVLNAQQEATYSVLVANGIGVTESDDATLTLNDKPTILAQPQSITAPAGANFALTVRATGSPSNLAYQWRKNGVAVGNATMSDFVFLDCATTSAGSYTVVITNIAGAVTSSVAIVNITNSRPIITLQPTNQNVNLNGNATFFVSASGSQPRTYQWRFNGATISAATNSFYRRTAIQGADAGSYSVVVSNSLGTATSAVAVLTVNFPPTITTQPLSQTVDVGSNLVLQVQATGTAPLGYQWYAQWVGKPPGQQPIEGYDGNIFETPVADVTLAGTYSVLVYNMAGHVFSSNITVTVNGPPAVIDDPQDITVSAGSNAVFTVSAVGPSLNYQWTRNGANIALATNAIYVRTNVQAADVGIYAVKVTNQYGSATSGNAFLSLDGASVFFDNFEAGMGNWTTLAGATALANSTTQKHSGTNAAICTSSSGKMFHNLPIAVEGHARATFWMYDNGGALSNWFGEMRSYVGSTNGQPTQILGLGRFSYSFSTNKTGDFIDQITDTNFYQGFVLAGDSTGYFNLDDGFSTPPRSNGWHQFVMERYADESTVDVSVDSNYVTTVYGTAPAPWDSVFIGSAGRGNTNGNVWFDDIKVEYLDPPIVDADPTDIYVHPGEGGFFSVAAHGNVTSYQWRFEGNAIANATNSNLSIPNAQLSNAGNYDVIVMNAVGAAVSAPALLSIVQYPPTFSFTQNANSLHITLDKNSTIYTSTNLVDWLPIGTNISQLDVPYTNSMQFFKADIPPYP